MFQPADFHGTGDADIEQPHQLFVDAVLVPLIFILPSRWLRSTKEMA